MNICWKSRMGAECKSGFTLIELLVVIAIIAILITLLVPSIGRAIATAQKVKCANNMRNIGQAWSMYAAEHQGKLVGSNTGDFDSSLEKDWVICRGGWRWNKEKKIEGIKSGQLWPYLNDLDVYRCPGTYGFMKEYVRNYSFVGVVGAPSPYRRWKQMSQIPIQGALGR